MKKKQQQIRCSSGASIAGRTDSPLQVIRLFFCLFCIFSPVLSSAISNPPHPPFNQTFVRVTYTLCLMDVVEAVPSIFTVLFVFLRAGGQGLVSDRRLFDGCLFFPVTDSGSSSSEDEGPNRQQSGPGARNGDLRRKRSRTPSPRRRPRGLSPRSVFELNS